MPSHDSRRKSKFKDIAGDLVSRGRESRKNAYIRFNLGQAIASELEKAYQLGLKAQKIKPDDNELPIQLCDIPRRFRAAFERLGMTISYFPRAGYIEHLDNKGHFYYDVADLEKHSDTCCFAMSSVHGLLKLGVLQEVEVDEYSAYMMSELGKTVFSDAVAAGRAIDL